MPWKNWKTLTKIPWRYYHDQFCPWSKIQPPNSLTILRNWKAVMKIATSWYLQGIWMVFRIVFEVLIKIDEVFGRFDISKILKILSNHIFEFWDFGLVDFAKWSWVLSFRWSFFISRNFWHIEILFFFWKLRFFSRVCLGIFLSRNFWHVAIFSTAFQFLNIVSEFGGWIFDHGQNWSWYLQGIWMVFHIVFEVLIKIDEIFGRFDI